MNTLAIYTTIVSGGLAVLYLGVRSLFCDLHSFILSEHERIIENVEISSRSQTTLIDNNTKSIKELTDNQIILIGKVSPIIGFYTDSLTTKDVVSMAIKRIYEDGYQQESEKLYSIVKEIYNFED